MIHVVIGTKAQLIKMAPILKYLKMQGIDYNYISTGQHKTTIDDILANFEIKKPDYILYAGSDITSIFAMIIWGLKIIFKTALQRKVIFKHDNNGIVLVHGDTFSTLLGALMGKIARLKIGHVESGLRSYNVFHPFPEEITRLLVFRLADYMFCPGEWAVKNSRKYKAIKINTQANTLADAIKFALPAIEGLKLTPVLQSNYAVVSLHRFENITSKGSLERVISIIENISKKYYLVFILHKPTELKLKEFGLYATLEKNTNIELKERYDYFKFIKLIMQAEFVVSDGGSNQEECSYLGKPILLLREATERKEGLSDNCVLSKYDPVIIREFIDNVSFYKKKSKEINHSPSSVIVDTCEVFI